MIKPKQKKKYFKAVSLDQTEIEYKILNESYRFMRYIVFIGLLVNTLVGGFYISAIYDASTCFLAIKWYFTLILLNVLNVIWARIAITDEYTHQALKRAWYGFCIIIILICVTWGSIGLLFTSTNFSKQLVTISILFSAVIAFTFPTSIDLKLGVSCIISLLLPITYKFFYLVNHSVAEDYKLNLAIALTLLVLGLFMLVSCYLANKMILKVLRVGYENDVLNQKLESMNTSLEKRVTKRTKALEDSLKLVTFQATHDLLTELPNERLLYKKITQLVEKGIVKQTKFAICCFSINNIGNISNSIGHQAVSTIMPQIARRLADRFSKQKKYFISLSRADTFVIVIDSLQDKTALEKKIKKLFDVLIDPVFIDSQQLRLNASIGISIFPEHGTTVNLLLTNAEAARITSSRIGGNSFRVYDKLINADAARILHVENLLYSAVENDELILQYQPFFNCKQGSICGAEALIRWKNPELGLVPPLEFIPIAEAMGMIIPIGKWVIQTACKQLKEWHNIGYKELKISINLSAKQLVQPSLVSFISKTLEELDLEPKYLDLELTESNAFHQEVLPLINQFIDLGISLSIDDFGTGYSEFSNLKLFKVNLIKIDKSFIEDINVNVDSKNIVRNTIALAKSMDIECIAEGVETKEQLDFLLENGCYLMQGYYFSKPVHPEDFNFLLTKHPKCPKI